MLLLGQDGITSDEAVLVEGLLSDLRRDVQQRIAHAQNHRHAAFTSAFSTSLKQKRGAAEQCGAGQRPFEIDFKVYFGLPAEQGVPGAERHAPHGDALGQSPLYLLSKCGGDSEAPRAPHSFRGAFLSPKNPSAGPRRLFDAFERCRRPLGSLLNCPRSGRLAEIDYEHLNISFSAARLPFRELTGAGCASKKLGLVEIDPEEHCGTQT